MSPAAPFVLPSILRDERLRLARVEVHIRDGQSMLPTKLFQLTGIMPCRLRMRLDRRRCMSKRTISSFDTVTPFWSTWKLIFT